MTSGLPNSRFNMWRAVIAMIHADQVVKPHEVNFVLQNISQLPLSSEQRLILHKDMTTPLEVDAAFSRVDVPVDRKDFFHLARALAWADGHFDDRERAVLERLKALSIDLAEMGRGDGNLLDDPDGEAADLRGRDPALFNVIKSLLGRAA